MGFLKSLGDALNSQFGIDNGGPSSALDSNGIPYSKLGDFRDKIDTTAARSYIEDGMIRNLRPRSSERIMQEPDITVLIKKRQFSSLIENSKMNLMDADEKLFIRATKRLFYNKCRAIAAYERLTKIERIVQTGGIISDIALPQIFNAVDSLNNLGLNIIDQKTQSTLETIKKVKSFSDPNYVTTWLIDSSLPYVTDVGEGTGVFELTLVSSVNTTVSTILGSGSADLSIEDPYKLMVISREDIERAISEAAGILQNNNFFRLADSGLEDLTNELRNTLNAVRRARGATDIRFNVNEGSLQYSKIRAMIDGEGREIFFSFDGGFLGLDSSVSIDPSAFEGFNGLSTTRSPYANQITSAFATLSERELFQRIVSNMLQLIGLRQSTRNQIKSFNKQTEYVRRKMFLHYNGQPMIQQMDVVHIFCSSKTRQDAQVSQGLRTIFGANKLNKINDTLSNVTGAFDDIKNMFGGSENSYIEIEKNMIAGPEFPTWLWSMMRNDFTRQAAGTQIFSGVVDSADHSYANGKYELKIGAKDNASYFKFGQININPSVDVFNSALYDPLTPFKLDFDASSGFLRGEVPPLLEENVRLLASGAVKAKNGRFRGSPLDEQLWKIQDVEPTPTSFRKKFHDPDGFVYRWKEGIGSLIWSGEPHSSLKLGSFSSEASIQINKNPFAGQDVMNSLSLLITGIPYNYNTFLRSAINAGSLNRDSLTNEDGSTSFFRGLISDLSKQNATWGNFIPFKKMIINESGYKFLATGEFDIIDKNARIAQLLRERAQRFDQLSLAMPEFANSPQFYHSNVNVTTSARNIDDLKTISADIIRLDFQIKAEEESLNKVLNNIDQSQGSLKIFGDDVSFDSNITQIDEGNESQRIAKRAEFRKKINNLTQRRLWKVKANEDLNLFIVDDSYDKNYDIQAFERTLNGKPELFKSTYTTIFDQIGGIADLLGMEVFADSQGHIQVRPPQYNRIPSSIFYKMLKAKEDHGIQLFPSFLENLFFNQVQGLTDQLEIIEDEIRIRAAALGYTSDKQCKDLLAGQINGANTFDFISSEEDGKVGGKDLRSLLVQSAPDLLEEKVSSALKELTDNLQGTLRKGSLFDVKQRVSAVNSNTSGSESDINAVINKVGKRLESKKNVPAPTKRSLLSNDRSAQGNGRSQVDALNLINQISTFVAERQGVIKLLANSLKNLDQGLSLNRSDETSENALFPELNKKKSDQFPEILEHMIEDEDYDDYGQNSGQRYVITDDRIISYSIRCKPPEFTAVQVTGQLATDVPPPALPSSLDLGDGGNGVATAYSVDYDMWRMFGFRPARPLNVAFFSDAASQCAPYGVALLNKARKDILGANITLVGNEYYQAGEVYYLEDRDLLFYAESVSHSFTYGGSFTSSMNLRYGHNPGEYIPTMLDIIGKGLYTNRHQASLARHIRHGNASNDTHIGTLIFDQPASFVKPSLDALVDGPQGEANRKALTNILLSITGLITPTTLNSKMKIEIRLYINSQKGISEADQTDLKGVADAVLEWVKNPSQEKLGLPGNDNTLFGSDRQVIPDNNLPNAALLADSISVVVVDLGTDAAVDIESDDRSPSAGAWNAARLLSLSGNSLAAVTQTDNETLNVNALVSQELSVLCRKVIDVWAVFEDPDEVTVATKDMNKDIRAQVDIDAQDAAIAAFNSKLDAAK